MSTLNIQLLCRNSKTFPYIIAVCFLTGTGLTLSGLNYPCLEQFFMVPKMFEPFKFDCIITSKDLLTLLLLNTTCPVLANSVDPDQLASKAN